MSLDSSKSTLGSLHADTCLKPTVAARYPEATQLGESEVEVQRQRT